MFKHNALRNFLLIAVASVAILAAYTIFFVVPSFSELLAGLSQNTSIRIATHLKNILQSRDIRLSRGSLPHDFDREAELLKKDFGLMKILVISPSGETVYSTDPADMGHVVDEKFFYDVVAKGGIFNEFVKKNTPSVSGQLLGADVVETYVPLMRDGSFFGACEVYMDITGLTTQTNAILVKSFSTLFFLVICLLAALAAASFKANRSMALQTKAEEALRESENLLHNILETEPECVKLIAPDNTLLMMNPAGLAMMEADSLDQVKGRRISSLIVTEHRRAFETLTKQTFEGTSGTMEFEMVGLKGGRLWLETHAVPIRNSKGEIFASLGVTRNITERKHAEDRLRSALREKDILLKEIHHRVKNNLQVVASMLGLQAREIKDRESRTFFEESRQRIETMSLIHEKLYRSGDLARIDFREYVDDLTSHLLSLNATGSQHIALETDIRGVSLDIASAIPCGLIMNELVSNALGHAFPGGRKGRITIRMRESDDGRITLAVSDDGIGLPEGLDFQNTKTLGLQLVISLAGQLGGTISLDRTAGTAFSIDFGGGNEMKGRGNSGGK
jgi:PAS domain S-box-containing protein